MRVDLQIPLALSELSVLLKAPINATNVKIKTVCTDTREAEAGDLFIALRGENDNGEKYVSDAKAKGCYVLAESNFADIRVTDTSEALLDIAHYYKSKLPLKKTVAVTGSVGKSTTVKFLSKILGAKYKVHSPGGNFNNNIGLPLTILSTPKDTEVLIAELGMNHFGEIKRLSECVNPDIAIITSVGTAHIGNFGTRENIAKAKLEILCGMDNGQLILPKGEPLLKDIENAVYVSDDSSLSQFSLINSKDGLRLTSLYGNINSIPFFDTREHLIKDLGFALSVSLLLGMSEDEIIMGVRSINQADLRQRFITLRDLTIFDDSYNASLESVIADLKFISENYSISGAFLGDILELGDSSYAIHEKIGREAARLGIGNLYLYGKFASYTRRGAVDFGMDDRHIFMNEDINDPNTSAEQILHSHHPGEVILFKASHKLRLDRIADMIKEKEEMMNDQR